MAHSDFSLHFVILGCILREGASAKAPAHHDTLQVCCLYFKRQEFDAPLQNFGLVILALEHRLVVAALCQAFECQILVNGLVHLFEGACKLIPLHVIHIVESLLNQVFIAKGRVAVACLAPIPIQLL